MIKNNKQCMGFNGYVNQADSIQDIEIIEGTREEKKEILTTTKNNYLTWLVLIFIIILLAYFI